MPEFFVLVIAVTLIFDFINGFHDAANAIATVVATKVLTPLQAVSMAAVGNLIGPLFFSVAVAKTVGAGIVDTEIVTVSMVFAALVGAIVWDLITWYLGLPTSSSHALVGGLIGAGLVAGGLGALVPDGIEKTLAFMVVSPAIGLVGGFVFTVLVLWIFKNFAPAKINNFFRKAQLLSAFFYSVTHGTNDAQKGMGIITLVLFTSGAISSFEVPLWVILAAHVAISLGTFFGGWKIVHTMASRITNIKPYQGFCAESAGGLVLAGMAVFGIPVSTTHVISSSIMGVGSVRRFSAVRWGVARRIIWAWVLTIPASAAVAAGVSGMIRILGG